MPKLRKDVQTNANRIDWRIRVIGKPEVLQIYPRRSLFVVEGGRPRLPPLLLEGYQGANNLMYIPKGSVLETRFVKVYPHHWLSQFLDSDVARFKWGITLRGGVPKVRNYDVIDGLGYAERKAEHVLAGYHEELRELRVSRDEIHAVLSGPTFLMSLQKEANLYTALERIEKREEEIRRILADRAVRDVNLHFALNRAVSRLTQMSATIERWASTIRQNPERIRIGSVQQMTNPILSELPFFGSKEIKPWVSQVRTALGVFAKRSDTSNVSSLRLAQSLEQASSVLFHAANLLVAEATSTPEEEKNAASQLRSGLI